MADKTKIAWCDATWNPTYGCGGCELGDHCYAARMASRFPERYPGLVKDGKWTGEVMLAEDRLELPLHWRRPRRIFVNSMGDLFASMVPDSYLARVWNVMSTARQHTFMILTKQPERMLEFLRRCGNGGNLGWMTHDSTPPAEAYDGTGLIVGSANCWPLPNVWLGVSITDQKTADQRIPLLVQTPAAVRFVSVEPMLGPVNLGGVPNPSKTVGECVGIDWVICGGESGPGARVMNTSWAMSLKYQCHAAKVPFFFKAWGGGKKDERETKDGLPVLDGRTWAQFPEAK